MAFTEQDRLNQEKQAAELAAEFNRLDAVYAGLMKDAGLTEADLEAIDPDKAPPEVKAKLDEIRQQARQAGETQAGQAKTAAAPAGPKPRPRAGALRG